MTIPTKLKKSSPGPDNSGDLMNAVIRLVVTVAIFAVVSLVSRSAPSDAASAESVRCELDPPSDIPGLETCLVRFPHDIELLTELGAAYEAAGRDQDAAAIYRRAIELDPRDADLRRRLAR